MDFRLKFQRALVEKDEGLKKNPPTFFYLKPKTLPRGNNENASFSLIQPEIRNKKDKADYIPFAPLRRRRGKTRSNDDFFASSYELCALE